MSKRIGIKSFEISENRSLHEYISNVRPHVAFRKSQAQQSIYNFIKFVHTTVTGFLLWIKMSLKIQQENKLNL